MHYIALATDYDGTIAHEGIVDEATRQALQRLRAGGRRLILVTGRELADLRRVMPQLDLFDLIVAENGALLFHPSDCEEATLAPPPSEAFIARLTELGVAPLSVGRAIVATWEPNEGKVLQAIRELGLDLQITFNKGAVMALPAGVNKASGLRAALEHLDLSPLNCVGIGDAENDLPFLDTCGMSVAVGNGVPALRERANLVTEGARGAGVAQLVDRILATDLAELDPHVPRQLVRLAERADGTSECVAAHRESLLLSGSSGGGKTTFTAGLLERLADGGFQVCVVDPEGDYEGMDGWVAVGAADQVPRAEQIMELLRKTGSGVSVNLLAVALPDRPRFLAMLLPLLLTERAATGRPHVIVIDEAHHMLPAEVDAVAAPLSDSAALSGDFAGFLFVTVHPDRLARRALQAVARVLVVGTSAGGVLHSFATARGVTLPTSDETPMDAPLKRGELVSFVPATGTFSHLRVISPEGALLRHRRKYAEGRLGEDKSFWFRGSDNRLNLRAHNLTLFVQMAEGVDEATWQSHRQRGDYSRWIAEAIKDEDLAEEAAGIERSDAPPTQARSALSKAIGQRYTLPA